MGPGELVRLALQARQQAYVPYSRFAVGAALLCSDGSVFTGSNIENASFSPTNCAERTAIFTAVHAGHRDFAAIAVVGGPVDGPLRQLCSPCGVCRQVLSEFCGPDFLLHLGAEDGSYRTLRLDQLLPYSFDFEI